MNTLSLDFHYQPRDPSRQLKGLLIVIALHTLLVYALVSGMARKGLNLIKKPLEAVVIQEVILPPPPPPPPPPPKELRPLPDLPPRANTLPLPVPQDVPPPPAASSIEMAQRETATPRPTPQVLALPEPVAAVPNVKAQAASMEAEYAGMLRAMLNSSKRYPTGRAASQQRPQGKVKVWFTLARTGALQDVGILESSNSNLLDDAALATVRRGSYPPFPANTWVDQESHKFSAEIEFNPPSA